MRWFLIKLLKFWQVFVSPLYPPSCRFHPTCSEYAILAVEKHGALKGSVKALWRVLRCNPWSKGGVDLP
ncbi:membrane protein insertion efficiency factor YidD [Hydrogenivirga sp.]